MTNCKNCGKQFEIRTEDEVYYKKFDVPGPEDCPDCRLQNKLCFRNERTFYKRKSSLSGQSMVSIYSEDADFPVYSPEEWWSDKHDGYKYGVDFDFSRGFFEQFAELQKKVPRIALFNVNPTNSEYCQQAYDNKNCYLCMVLEECEDSMYLSHSNRVRTSFDGNYLQHSELCHDCIDSTKLYNCIGCQSCQNSNDLMFCYDCIGCHDCIGCFGLRNKQYWIMNKQLTQAEYEEKKAVLEFNKYSKFANARDYFLQWTKDLPHRASRNFNVENCTGDYLINGKNCHQCFDSYEIQDSAYCTWIFNSHDCYDVYGLGYSEWVYEGLGVERLNNCAFNTFVSNSHDSCYNDLCFHSRDLFGCVGMKNANFCIFNKKYSEEEYRTLRAKIVEHMKKTGEWGKFFSNKNSQFAYNETAAKDHFPLTEEEATSKGFRWKQKEKKEYLPATCEIPDDTKTIDEKFCQEMLACSACGKNYKIMPNELKFYKRMNISVPRKCPDCRHAERLALRNPGFLWERKCAKCGANIKTSYSPDRLEVIHCETCYADGVQ